LISVDSFALEEDKEHLNLSPHCLPPVNVNVIYSEVTDVWINIHDILHFFPCEDKSKLTFLWASEETGFRHLYQITVALTAQLANCVDEAVPLDGNEKNKSLIERFQVDEF
jgi:Dipeptidyl peptidase IV (DPP IV) N-terminal region